MTSGNFRTLTDVEIEFSKLSWKDHGPIAGKGQLPSHTKEKAHRELGETEEVKNYSIAKLRDVIKNGLEDKDENLRKGMQERFEQCNDDVLVRFLRARKYNVDRTIELMTGNVRYRLNYPEIFTKIKQSALRECVIKGQPGVLQSRDNEGRVVMFFRIENWDPVEYPFSQAIQYLVHILEKLLESEETQVNGICLVEDFRGYSMTQVASVGLTEYKKMVDMLQGSFPSRFKGIYCIRQPWFFAKTYNIIKPLLRAKLFNRVFLYGEDLLEFYNAFPKEFLPEELGGTGPPYDGEKVADLLFGPANEEDELTVL